MESVRSVRERRPEIVYDKEDESYGPVSGDGRDSESKSAERTLRPNLGKVTGVV